MYVVFNRVDKGVYEGFTIKCRDRAVPLMDVEGYSLMRKYLLRNEGYPVLH